MPPRKKPATHKSLRQKRGRVPDDAEKYTDTVSSFEPIELDNVRVNKRARQLPLILSGQATYSQGGSSNNHVSPDPYQASYTTSTCEDAARPHPSASTSIHQSRKVPTARKAIYNDILNVGKPECCCQHCGAMFWYQERLDRNRKTMNPVYSLCCQKGRVNLPLLKQPPPLLAQLLDLNGGPLSKHFREHIRPYNGALCFTSFGAKLDPRSLSSRGPYSMVICGENYHRIGSLLPIDGEKPKFAQLYIFEPENEIDNRLSNFASRDSVLLPELLTSLLRMLDETNELVQTFRRIRQELQQSTTANLRLRIFGIESRNRQYDLPTSTDIVALIPGDFVPDIKDRDIIVNHRDQGLKRISSLNPKFEALHFPLLFPYGEDGYHPLIPYNSLCCPPTMRRKFVTQREYYAYRLQYRSNEGYTLVKAGKALQHYCVDAFSTIELNRLAFLRTHQKELRSEVYQGLEDAFARGDMDGDKIGRIIIPSSYTGGPRYMQQLYHDAMATCQYYGNPDLFITFTCNALWEEITEAFADIVGPNSEFKPMIVCRVFHMKLAILIEEIRRESYFGKTIAIIYTVEFQKRGLPHVHMLIWLAEEDKPKTVSDIDEVISAEIPNPDVDPVGYETVIKFMLHGPCGEANPNAPCMKDGKCSKFYPKEFNSETTFDRFGNVIYRRRNSGIQVQKGSTVLDNRHVVPYNRNFLVRAQAHINIEICHKGGLVKYLFKYITKGPDRSMIIAEETATSSQVPTEGSKKNKDEIQEFIDCRSLSSYEAIWRINEYPIHHREPAVVRLDVHLPGQQKVPYRKQSNIQKVLQNPKAGKTHLTSWFLLNQKDPEARNLTYAQIPNAYTWNEDYNEWTPRKRGFAIGRIAYVPPGSNDVFFLRLMLTKVRGAVSYLALRTVRGEVCASYEKACEKLGLLSDSSEWIQVLQEISASSMPSLIRTTFVSMLMFCEIPNPTSLFEASWKLMSEDRVYSLRKQLQSTNFQPSDETLRNWVLNQIETLLGTYSSSLEHFNLPKPTDSTTDDGSNPLINEYMSFDTVQQQKISETMLEDLNQEQLGAFSAVMLSVNNNLGKSFFLYGHGGTGKTFLYNAIIAKLRSESKIAIVVASSGIAATLLPNGTTAHSRFKIPLHVDTTSTCSIKKGTHLAELIKKASLIVWDEAPMTHRNAFEAISRTLCDIMNVPIAGPGYKLFGGKTVLFGGDFRQTLPVISDSGREQTVDGSLTRSMMWSSFTILKLSRNMRLNESVANKVVIDCGYTFGQWVLNLGDGKLPTKSFKQNTPSDWIKIPEMFLVAPLQNPIQSITCDIYESFAEQYKNTAYLTSRAIVTPTNAKVNEINEFMLQQLPEMERTYYSSDSMQMDTEVPQSFSENYPTEFLNTLAFNGVPDHEIKLKVHAPVMLLRNLSPSKGLCNGTRLMITYLGENVIKGTIMGGPLDTKLVAIPRIVLNIEEKKWPFILKRRQFPVRLCYGMTINKSQGQTLDKVGVYLPDPVFSHGQLYVAVSRVKSADGLRFLITNTDEIPDNYTRNIVYTEAFEDISTDQNSTQPNM